MDRKNRGIISLFLLFIVSISGNLWAEIISEARMLGVPRQYYDTYIKPYRDAVQIKSRFRESYHRGTYYEIGRSEAAAILKTDKDFYIRQRGMIQTLVKKNDPAWTATIEDIKDKLKVFFPEYLEEVRGFAEGLNINQDDAIRFLSFQYTPAVPGCTVFAIGAERSVDNHVLIGRSYEWIPSLADMSVAGIEPGGGYRSIGSTMSALGRLDGINEHGLFVAMAGSFSRRKDRNGFLFPLVVRATLDRCSDVNEAVRYITEIRLSGSVNILVADRSGNAAVIEAVPKMKYAVRWLKDDPDKILIMTNHFQNRRLRIMNSYIMPNSNERARIIRRLFGKKRGVVTEGAVRSALVNERPNGVYWKNYGSVFGTLYSGVYDLNKGTWKNVIAGTDRDLSPVQHGPDAEFDVTYENRKPALLDFVPTTGAKPEDVDSFQYRARLVTVYTSSILNPLVHGAVQYKKGLGTDRSYGPNMIFSVFATASFAFTKAGVSLSVNPVSFFSFEVTPFYLVRYPSPIKLGGSYLTPIEKILRSLNGVRDRYNTPAISINPIFRFGGLVTFENKFTFYDLDNRYFEYETNMLVRKGPVWSPSLEVLVPCTRYFLWGLKVAANFEILMKHYRWDPSISRRYNVNIGPVLVFPEITYGVNLYINLAYWVKLSEGTDSGRWDDHVLAIIALQGNF